VKKVNNNDRMSLDDDDFKDKFIDKDMLMENKEMRMWRNGSWVLCWYSLIENLVILKTHWFLYLSSKSLFCYTLVHLP